MRRGRSAVQLVWRAAPLEFALTIVLQVLSGVALAAQLLVGSRVFAHVLENGDEQFSQVLPGLALLAVVSAAKAIATSILNEEQRLLTELTGRYAQQAVIRVASKVDYASYDSPGFYDQLQRAQAAAAMRPYRLTMELSAVLSSVIGSLSLIAVVAAFEPLLLPLLVLGVAPVSLAVAKNSRSNYSFGFGMTPSDRKRSYLFGLLTGKSAAKELRVFGLASTLCERYSRLYDDRVAELRMIIRQRVRRSVLAGLASSIVTASCIGLISWLALSGRTDIPAAVASAVAIQQFGSRLDILAFSGAGLYESALFLDDFASFLELDHSDDTSRAPAVSAPSEFEKLTIDRVTFKYPGATTPALKDVSFTIRAGEVTALVGENGSGKTTLAKLLCHLYLPTSGSIYWDDVDTALCDAVDLRSRVAVIFQDFVQYLMPAADNIGFGAHENIDDMDGIVAAATEAGADDFLSRLPNGYASVLGREFDGGAELSIGQWQRVALARAYFRQAPLVILDEPTAAIDARAEHQLFERIRDVFRGRTVLLISHRFANVRSADQILVLDEGKLVERGTHDELIRQNHLYSELFTLQGAAYRTGDGNPLGHNGAETAVAPKGVRSTKEVD